MSATIKLNGLYIAKTIMSTREIKEAEEAGFTILRKATALRKACKKVHRNDGYYVDREENRDALLVSNDVFNTCYITILSCKDREITIV